MGLLENVGRLIARFLEKPSPRYEPHSVTDPEKLATVLQPGDVLLIEGNQRLSAAIKYLTQSTWSHAALYIGDALGPPSEDEEPKVLIEMLVAEGAIAVPLSKYAQFNSRICRPIGLTPEDRAEVVRFLIDRLGLHYDMKNIIDLMRYLLPEPPVPVSWRRRMLALGSGEPTKAICSTLIAQAFQSVRYPILPTVEQSTAEHRKLGFSAREILHIRHHSLFTPRDFDLSPYFEVVKPTLKLGFDYRAVEWADYVPLPRSETKTGAPRLK